LAYNILDYENYDYREFWQDDKRKYEDAAERIALKKLIKDIPHREGEVFVDLGCGYGRLISEYKDFKNIILIDYSLNNLKNARRRISAFLEKEKLESVYFICADALNIPLADSSINCLISVRLIHHIKDIPRYFTEVSRVLADKAFLVLEFANKRNLKNIIKYFLRRSGGSPFDGAPFKVGDTILNWHPKTIIGQLANNNLKVIKQVSVSNLRVSFLKRRLKFSTHIFLEKAAQKLFSASFIGPSIFLKSVIKKEEPAFHKGTDPKIFDIIVCPKCKKKIYDDGEKKMKCQGCSRIYPIVEGVLDLRT
jgi:ubiquinone/menaquinone biosynthesis C-methylase UbiE